MIPGVILAAGRSTRMGRPKALLPIGDSGVTFVTRLVQTLLDGGINDVLVVGRPEDGELRREVEGGGLPVRLVENPRAETGQLSSVIAALNAADHPGVRGMLVTLVDLPLVTPQTIGALLSAFSSTGASVVRATHQGRHGHPVIFGRPVFDDLRRADPAIGAKAVLRAGGGGVVDIEVDDPGVLFDVDLPEDYARLLASTKPRAEP
jgi:molybdenum cofactor cytidylyltransferase